ncbi:hypothetical protein Glove_113g64 [Diversispora epigaea]|uniref:Uncharacterized protein n=1 Tax=Diversispora epigaea TaxID=1348612 RepID=A0A397J1X1_9GLOM|nr:hypothetical protein Glove_113g64 [Diversispora epigaea]
MTSMSRSEQSEGTYVTDVIIPLLRSCLGGLPNGTICLSTVERQSLASKARRNLNVDEERMGKKPDVMGLLKQDDKIFGANKLALEQARSHPPRNSQLSPTVSSPPHNKY